ncbi:MAG: hypothetical protein MZW92_41875 [Comamonadaceae bacterium]|nr:hypothetical protein [Comamonadaceae bacterium]
MLGKVSNKRTIQITRRIVAADGRPAGVVVASLDPAYFESVFSRVAIGTLGSVALVGGDLVVRARVTGGKPSGNIGEALSPDGPFARQALHREGQFLGPSSLDGRERFYSYRRVADYPLYVVVSTARDEALVDWRTMRNVALVLTLLLSGAVAVGAVVFVVALRRLEA